MISFIMMNYIDYTNFMNRNSQPLLGSFFIVFLKHPGALGNHLRTQLGTHIDRALNADGLPGNPRTRLPGFTHAHTPHTCTHTHPGTPLGITPVRTRKFGPDGTRTRAGSAATAAASQRTFGPFANTQLRIRVCFAFGSVLADRDCSFESYL